MLKRLRTNDFMKSVLTLFTGTAIAQILPVAITPLLTRIYSPNEFGIFALYTSIVTILYVLSTGRYELAIIIPKSDKEAINIAGLAAIINVCISVLLFLILLIGGERLAQIFGISELGIWLYVIPFSLILTGFYYIIYNWLNRRKMYKDMSSNKVIQQGGIGLANITMGYAGNGLGLILGTIFGQLFSLVLIIKKLWKKERDYYFKINRKELLTQAKRYDKFPKFFMVANFLNVSSRNLAQILFSIFFNPVMVGYFTLTQRALGFPVSIIGTAIADVFRQRAAEDLERIGNCKKLYIKTFGLLLLISIIPFSLLYLISPWLFSFVFGEEWRIAGEYARLMMPMLFLQFITSPLSYMSILLEKNKFELFLQLMLITSTTTALMIGYFVFGSIRTSIILYTIAYSIFYIVEGTMSYRFAVTGKESKKEKNLKTKTRVVERGS